MLNLKQSAKFCVNGLAVAIAMCSAAHAQEAGGQNVRALEEIIVSARRTEESLQSVPVSVTALDDSLLRENSITTTEDLQQSIPGVYLAGSGGRQNVIYQIRGQSKALSGTSSPAVVSYFAEVPEPVWGSSVPQFDMASIQVLKGPQGTLFGRNTTGGAILYTPKAPEHEFGGYVGGTLGNYDQQRVQGAVNLPIVQDKIALRLAADINKRDGYTKNIGVGKDLDATDTETFRASLLIQPTDYISNTTIYEHFESDNDGTGVVLDSVFPGNTLLAQLGLQQAAFEQLELFKQRGPFKNDPSFPQFERNERESIINRTEVDFGAFQLVNIFGYRDTELNYAINVDAMPQLLAFGVIPAGFIKADLYQATEQYSNEIQFKGMAFDDKLNWLIGGFWLKSEPTGPQGNAVAFAPELIGFRGSSYNFLTEKSKAIFGHVQYDLSDMVVEGLQLELGVRYTEDEIESCTGTGVEPFVAGPDGITGQSNAAEESDCRSGNSDVIVGTSSNGAKSDATTWSIGLNWQVNDDLFLYAVKRHGYRAGGINAPTLVGRMAQYQAFEPETVTDYEIGMRSDWMVGDVAVRTNISAFIGEYKDVQGVLTGVQTSGQCDPNNPDNPPGISPDGDCNPSNDPAGGTLLVNLGETEVSGVDLELVIAPTDHLTVNLGASYLDTETKSISQPFALDPYITTEEIPFNYTAQKTFLAGIRYEWPMDNMAESLVFNADYYWTDDAEKTDLTLPSYDVTNLRLDLYGVAKTPLDLSVFVRNVFDDEYAVAGGASGTFLGFETSIYGPPRMWGMEARYSF